VEAVIMAKAASKTGVEHVGAEELAERYVKPTGRALATTAIERIVYAEKV
jgi:hypothetical protein